MTVFVTNCGMECYKEEHIRKIPKAITFEWYFRPFKSLKFNRQKQLPETLSQTQTSSS